MNYKFAATLLTGFLIAGLGPHSCVQFLDTGRLILHAEGTPDPRIAAWVTGPQVTPMPQDLVEAWSRLSPCLPGKDHS